MDLTAQQLVQFERDGYLIFPSLFSKSEIAVLRAETARLSLVQSETVIRERTGGVRSIFRVHEDDGATRSAAFRALVRTPRVLAPTRQALGTDEVYVYLTKINTKPAIEGTVWMWHQGLRLVAARRLPAPRHGDLRGHAHRLSGDERRAVCGSRQPPAGTHRAVLRREHFVQVLGRSKAGNHFRITTIGKTRSDRRSRRNRGAVPLQPAARLGPQPQRRGPLAHLHLVQCLRQRAAVRAEFASRLGGVEKHRAPARGKRRRRPAGSVNSSVLRE